MIFLRLNNLRIGWCQVLGSILGCSSFGLPRCQHCRGSRAPWKDAPIATCIFETSIYLFQIFWISWHLYIYIYIYYTCHSQMICWLADGLWMSKQDETGIIKLYILYIVWRARMRCTLASTSLWKDTWKPSRGALFQLGWIGRDRLTWLHYLVKKVTWP